MENWLCLIKGTCVVNCCIGIFSPSYSTFGCFNLSSQNPFNEAREYRMSQIWKLREHHTDAPAFALFLPGAAGAGELLVLVMSILRQGLSPCAALLGPGPGLHSLAAGKCWTELGWSSGRAECGQGGGRLPGEDAFSQWQCAKPG